MEKSDQRTIPIPGRIQKQIAGSVAPLPGFGEGIYFKFAQDAADYYSAIQRVDAFAGGCLDLLEKSGLAENTIVIFSADHGPCYGRGKLSLSDFGTQVPESGWLRPVS